MPVGLLAAVAVATTLGGGGALGRVGQLVGGPEIPSAQTAVALGPTPASTSRGTSATALPTFVLPAAGSRSPATSGAATPSRPRPAGGAPKPTAQQPAAKPAVPGAPTPASQPAPDASSPTGSPPPSPPSSNPLRQAGKAVQKTLTPVPVVGPVAADAVGTVIDLIAPQSPSSSLP